MEFKNPYAARDMTIHDAVTKLKNFCLKQDQDGLISLRPSHSYFYQIQATMLCTKRKWCDFVLCTKEDMHVERIPCTDLMNTVLPTLQSFYFNAILPELACPRNQNGGIREPQEWLIDSTDWQDKVSKL